MSEDEVLRFVPMSVPLMRAIRLLLDWARFRGASQVVLSVALDNLASQRTADKLGFALREEYEHDARGRELLYGLAL